MICNGCGNLIQADDTILVIPGKHTVFSHDDHKCLTEAVRAELTDKKTDQICSCGMEINSSDDDYLVFWHNGREVTCHDDQECLEKTLGIKRYDGYSNKAVGW